MRTWIRKSGWRIAVLAWMWMASGVSAQDQGLGDMLFTAGTVTNVEGQEWGWIQWMATESALLQNQPMDLYVKEGNALSLKPFVLQGHAMQVTDPRSLAVLLERGEALGENLTRLEMVIDSLYAEAAPAESLSLAEKLSALISGSQSNPQLYQNLIFMGRAHPVIAMAIGQGYAGRIASSGFTTYEVRDAATSEVIGRVTLEAGEPVVLPAPGPIVRVPEPSPKGHLNIRLRWEIPTELKRVSLLQFGYNLYRMDGAFAEAEGFDITPPGHGEIAEMVDAHSEVVKVNRMPILVDPAEVTASSWFAVDDNEGLTGGVPFDDGQTYYYFVSALDLLGRDGDLSEAFLAAPYDRVAPSVPSGVQVQAISDFVDGQPVQWLQVSWNHNTNDTDVAGYYVYRHTSLAEMQHHAASAGINRISAKIVPEEGARRVTYDDHSLNTNDVGTTYWYTVRTEDHSSGGHNLSGNSAPGFGTLRDWEGPSVVTGAVVTISMEDPSVIHYDKMSTQTLPPHNIVLASVKASVDLPIAWAEFAWYPGGFQGVGEMDDATLSGRIFYPNGIPGVTRSYFFDQESNVFNGQITYLCRVGTQSGTVSPWAHYTDKTPTDKSAPMQVRFKADLSMMDVAVGGGDPSATGTPPVVGPHRWGGPTIRYPVVTIPPTPDAHSYRLYRRVDGGPRSLIAQGEMDELLGAIVTDETGGSVNGGRICYYYQLFDEHGNSGPMVLICCFLAEPRVDLPTPVLDPIDALGDAEHPKLEMSWFCSTPGVERFEVALALDDGPLPVSWGTQSYPRVNGAPNEMDVVIGGQTNSLVVGFYQTGRVGVTFGNGDLPQFELSDSIVLDREYTVMVRAVGVAGIPGPWSNAEVFRWRSVPVVGPDVPWPARELPVVQETSFHPRIEPVFLTDDDYWYRDGVDCVGIRVGAYPSETNVKLVDGKVQLNGIYDPLEYLFANAVDDDQTVLPCVLYRYQLTNELYRTVSGDVVQVSPLMETIAWGLSSGSSLYDPFAAVTRLKEQYADPWDIFLLDTQPVVRGAKYQYLLLRFNEQTRELDRVIPAGTIEIP